MEHELKCKGQSSSLYLYNKISLLKLNNKVDGLYIGGHSMVASLSLFIQNQYTDSGWICVATLAWLNFA